jgi:peptide/nickel transport system substrate-binding protein
MDYRKHADYWGGDPFIEKWQFPVIPEYANRMAQFIAGSIFDFTPTARDVLTLAKDVPQTVIVAAPIADDSYSWINFGKYEATTQPTKDPRVRVALRRAINFKGIGEFLSNKQQFEAAGVPVDVVTRTHAAHDLAYWLDPEKGELGALSANYLHDVAEARKLVTAAGNNNVIDIEYTVLPAAGEVPEGDTLTIDSLNKSGLFRIKVNTSANTVVHRECRSVGNCVGIVQSSINEDPDYILRKYHTNGARPGADSAYPHPRLDSIADTYRRELDAQKRIALIKEMQTVAAEHMPVVPYIHQYTSFTFRWPWLHNLSHGDLSVQGLEGRPALGGHLHWLDKDTPRRNG